MGGFWRSITRTCTGEVCVRSTTSDSPATAACVAGEVLDVEGVLEAARGMVGRGVERGEVVVVELDLGPGRDAVAEADEDLDDLGDDLVDEVHVARGATAAGQRDVDGLGGDAPLELGGREQPRAAPRARPRAPSRTSFATLPDLGPLLGRRAARARARTPVSDPFLPRYATRTASSVARSSAGLGLGDRRRDRAARNSSVMLIALRPPASERRKPTPSWDITQGRKSASAVPPWLPP